MQLEASANYLITQTHARPNTLDHSHLIRVYDADGNLLQPGFYYPYHRSWMAFQASTTGKHFIAAASDSLLGGTGTYTLAVTTLPADDIADDTTTASVLAVGGSVSGTIGTTLDYDWHRVTLTAGTEYVFDIAPHYGGGGGGGPCANPNTAVRGNSNYAKSHCLTGWRMRTDVVLSGLYDAAGAPLQAASVSPHGPYRITYTAPSDSVYYVATRGRSNHLGDYTVTLETAGNASQDDYPADATTTGTVSAASQLNGSIDYIRDVDWVQVSMQAGIGYIFKVWELSDADGNRRHTVERNAKVFHSNGQRLGGKPILEAGLWFSRLRGNCFEVDTDAEYYVQVEGRHFYLGPYELIVTEQADGCD